MYDSLELARQTAKIVCQGVARKYYRFRPARFYGGIATADCLGCNLRCAFCWAWEQVHRVEKVGEFYEPQKLAAFSQVFARVSLKGCTSRNFCSLPEQVQRVSISSSRP